ncbi:uncharacterized protein A1O5_06306 [Cladophialophora psammophila CBS 110553]|uniref:Uncharacterized protein n=1 Tax=Cladophialophora psammophila CBS 110553 TaxID=1182543 RepID=W9WQP0_9EURO|nr:uncharacterized protein A1O5_06306 [Cladophialophora psammophila CBS 110553]EXJ70238.1 hypothetical protein A1O5_06306 [Cladophialophora psammophila CBS 110553]
MSEQEANVKVEQFLSYLSQSHLENQSADIDTPSAHKPPGMLDDGASLASWRAIPDDITARERANDAAADAAFRAAAEADAAREKEKKESKRFSSWFDGWLGGKKADSLDAGPATNAEQKVYRANLGESKMRLYYDKELGKWVHSDNPDAAKKTATPPPPRMGGTPRLPQEFREFKPRDNLESRTEIAWLLA